MKTAIVALALAAQLVPMHASPANLPQRGECFDLGPNSGCLYLLAADEYPAWVFVQTEYEHCLAGPHGRVFEDGSIEGCK